MDVTVIEGHGMVYLLGAPLPLRRRVLHHSLAAVLLLVVSLSWAVIVDLTQVSQRPFVSDSGSNSELSPAHGYNGLGRVTQALFSCLTGVHILWITIDLQVAPAFARRSAIQVPSGCSARPSARRWAGCCPSPCSGWSGPPSSVAHAGS